MCVLSLPFPRQVRSRGGLRLKRSRGNLVLRTKKRRRVMGVTALYSADPVERRSRVMPNHRRLAAGQRTIVDREISKLFRPTWLSLLPASKAFHSPAGVEHLLQAESRLAKFLDFSRVDFSRLDAAVNEGAQSGSHGSSRDPAWETVRRELGEREPADLAELAPGPPGGTEASNKQAAAARRGKTYSR
jgi:hypothetical protein